MQNKIILDLCGGSGSWGLPYEKAGYKVLNITLPEYDVTKWREYPELVGVIESGQVYGILAAPPCTMFSLARTRAKKPRDFREGMACVKACLEIIHEARFSGGLKFWALENPMGYLRQFLGKAPFKFDPSDFGDRYTKKTELWGYYNFPTKKPIVLSVEEMSLMSTNSRKLPSISDFTGSNQQARRSITPKGFAEAFYKANK